VILDGEILNNLHFADDRDLVTDSPHANYRNSQTACMIAVRGLDYK